MTQEVITLPVGQMESNCYIYKFNKEQAIVIDPGDDSDYIIQKLLDYDLMPVIILATHGHFDHIMAGFSIQTAFNCPFFVGAEDRFLLERMRETAIHFGEEDPGPAPIVTTDIKTASHMPLKLIKTPGHTPGSISYYEPHKKILFVGDLVFSDGTVGETTHKYSNKNHLKVSLKTILNFDPETIIYPGHGEPATVGDLKSNFFKQY